jgi:putative ABC transport system permease protein
MKTLWLAWHYLWARALGTVLNVVLLSLGLASITFLVLVGAQIAKAFERDLAGIDAVVGAKGSPMQLILSGVLHLDVPTGNVPLSAITALGKSPLVKELIPISLGDNFSGYRIVGTSHGYMDHYKAVLSQGRTWDAPMQAVLGATTARTLGLALGQTFVGSHGLGAGGHAHGNTPYTVVGILEPNGSVLDRLIITDSASVWKVHEDYIAQDDEDRQALEAEREITMALVVYTTPMAALSFPRYVNTQTDMQAAAPALEVSRLLHMLGLGTQVLQAFAGVLLLTAGLSVFIALWGAVRERRADLALLRMLGAPPRRVAALLLCEALWLGLMASAVGLLLGQLFWALLSWLLALDNAMVIGGMVWPQALLLVPALAFGVSLLSALLPTWAAYRVSVLELLQSR